MIHSDVKTVHVLVVGILGVGDGGKVGENSSRA